MTVTLRFLGALRHSSGTDTLTLDCQEAASVLDLIDAVTLHSPTLRRNLLDEQLENPTSNALILLNGKEISALNGLQTKVKDWDEVVFVPVVHGG
jgi:molybdopterin synthase sulfur carrier subunit